MCKLKRRFPALLLALIVAVMPLFFAVPAYASPLGELNEKVAYCIDVDDSGSLCSFYLDALYVNGVEATETGVVFFYLNDSGFVLHYIPAFPVSAVDGSFGGASIIELSFSEPVVSSQYVWSYDRWVLDSEDVSDSFFVFATSSVPAWLFPIVDVECPNLDFIFPVSLASVLLPDAFYSFPYFIDGVSHNGIVSALSVDGVPAEQFPSALYVNDSHIVLYVFSSDRVDLEISDYDGAPLLIFSGEDMVLDSYYYFYGSWVHGGSESCDKFSLSAGDGRSLCLSGFDGYGSVPGVYDLNVVSTKSVGVFSVFTGVGSWFVSAISNATSIFWTPGVGLTVLGVLALASLAIAFVILFACLLAGWLKFK